MFVAGFTFQHIRDTPNVGDLACTPGQWFDFGGAERVFQNFGMQVANGHVAVFGGGQTFRWSADGVIYNSPKARARVIWGVGITAKHTLSLEFDIVQANVSLIGSRNWNVPRTEFVPCASAMSPLFDAPPAPKHDVVLFRHAAKSAGLEIPAGIPMMSNHGVSFDQAVAFIASGATVVTNSYHGTYWAMLLGRKVLCLPFSDKFRGFQDMPVLADPGAWSGEIAKAEARPGQRDTARQANRRFYEKVMNLV